MCSLLLQEPSSNLQQSTEVERKKMISCLSCCRKVHESEAIYVENGMICSACEQLYEVNHLYERGVEEYYQSREFLIKMRFRFSCVLSVIAYIIWFFTKS